MSTINKILKTLGVSAGLNLVGEKVYNMTQSQHIECFGFLFPALTLPASVVCGIDQYINQNITSNKTTQYVLTAVESASILPTVFFLITAANAQQQNAQEQSLSQALFEAFCTPSLGNGSGEIKLYTAGVIIQSLAFKYIWDSSDEIDPELDSGIDQQADLI